MLLLLRTCVCNCLLIKPFNQASWRKWGCLSLFVLSWPFEDSRVWPSTSDWMSERKRERTNLGLWEQKKHIYESLHLKMHSLFCCSRPYLKQPFNYYNLFRTLRSTTPEFLFSASVFVVNEWKPLEQKTPLSLEWRIDDNSSPWSLSFKSRFLQRWI